MFELMNLCFPYLMFKAVQKCCHVIKNSIIQSLRLDQTDLLLGNKKMKFPDLACTHQSYLSSDKKVLRLF